MYYLKSLNVYRYFIIIKFIIFLLPIVQNKYKYIYTITEKIHFLQKKKKKSRIDDRDIFWTNVGRKSHLCEVL